MNLPHTLNRPSFKKWFLGNVQKISKYFHYELNKLKNEYPKIIKEVRGVGLLIGLKLYKDQTNFIKKLQDNKLLTIMTKYNKQMCLSLL